MSACRPWPPDQAGPTGIAASNASYTTPGGTSRKRPEVRMRILPLRQNPVSSAYRSTSASGRPRMPTSSRSVRPASGSCVRASSSRGSEAVVT